MPGFEWIKKTRKPCPEVVDSQKNDSDYSGEEK